MGYHLQFRVELCRDGTGPVIRNVEGEAVLGPRYWFEPALPKAKIRRFSWHCLRHTFASRLVMVGVDLRTVQELMAHKSIEMTVRYSHLAPKHTLAAVERLTAADSTNSTGTTTGTSTSTSEQNHGSGTCPINPFTVRCCSKRGARSSAVRAADS
jgi:hypothetical protein